MTSTIGAATNGAWMTFTYVASNPDAQRLIADLLGNFHDIEVDTSTAGDDPIVKFACPNPQRAESLHDVSETLDWGARPAMSAVNPLSDALTA
jgi:hypothetical protein